MRADGVAPEDEDAKPASSRSVDWRITAISCLRSMPERLTNQGYHFSCSGQCMDFTGQTNMATWAELQASVSGVLQTVPEFKTDTLK